MLINLLIIASFNLFISHDDLINFGQQFFYCTLTASFKPSFYNILLTFTKTLTITIKRKELTLFERGEIIGVWKCEIKERDIEVALNHPKVQFMILLQLIKILAKKYLLLE